MKKVSQENLVKFSFPYLLPIIVSFCFISTLISCSEPTQKKEAIPTENQNEGQSKKEKLSKTILFFGNSLSAGYGIDKEACFVSLVEDKVQEKGLDFRVINAGLSGETSSGGLSRIDWILRTSIDVFVLELGGNDALRGIEPQETLKNLKGILEKVKKSNPKVKLILAGMEAPPNMGEKFTSDFRKIYRNLQEEYKCVLIPFLLKDVGGIPDLNLPDGIHPTPQGHKIVSETVWEYLEPVLVPL